VMNVIFDTHERSRAKLMALEAASSKSSKAYNGKPLSAI